MDMPKRAAVAVSGMIFAGAAALAVGAAIPANAEVRIGAPMDHEKSQSRDDAQRDTNGRVKGSLKDDDDESTEDAKENANEDAEKDAKENASENADEHANKDADENADEDDSDDINNYRPLNELRERGLERGLD